MATQVSVYFCRQFFEFLEYSATVWHSHQRIPGHSSLEKADGRTWKKHSMKFRHIGYNVDPYAQSFFPKSISITICISHLKCGMAFLKNCRGQHFGSTQV